MSTLAMTKNEREAFLADLHVGVISIEQQGAPPLSVPIWYDYAPDRGVWLVTGANSAKGKRLREAVMRPERWRTVDYRKLGAVGS